MRKPKTRGNGQGTAFKRGNTWTAEVVVGWAFQKDPSKPKRPIRRTKGGFKTKKDAINYCATLLQNKARPVNRTLDEVYSAWSAFYEPRVGASTMACYAAAYKHFARLHGVCMNAISPEDLQTCMDECEAGKRTRQNMRTTAGLLWKYAIDHEIVQQNITTSLYTGSGASVQREPLTPSEEETIRKSIGKERYAEYIYCMCNLGFRPGEFLELKKSQLFCANTAQDDEPPSYVWYFVNGKKTSAGKNRVVVVPSVILPIILSRLYVPGTDLIFPRYVFSKKHGNLFKCFKPMEHEYFNKFVFKPMMARLGIAEGKVPYGARHTYADKLKKASGSDKDKASLIGHSDYLFTQSAYQSTSLNDLRDIVESF